MARIYSRTVLFATLVLLEETHDASDAHLKFKMAEAGFF